MTDFIRPFTKVVTVTSGVSNVINLLDSAGNALMCNYIKVDHVATPGSINQNQAETSFFVLLSSIPGITTPGPAGTVTAVNGLTGSGFCGFFSTGGGGESPTEIRLVPKDAVSRITIILTQGSASTVNMAITYGVTQGVNQLRLNNMPEGN